MPDEPTNPSTNAALSPTTPGVSDSRSGSGPKHPGSASGATHEDPSRGAGCVPAVVDDDHGADDDAGSPVATEPVRRRASRSSRRAGPAWHERRGVRAALLCAGVVMLVGTVVALSAGERALAARASQVRTPDVLPTLVINWPTVRGAGAAAGPGATPEPPATWMPKAIREKLLTLIRTNVTPDPLDRESLRTTAEALMATGWFTSTPTLRREPGSRVRVIASWREPVAVVRYAGQDHLIGHDAHLLPLTYKAGESGLRVVFDPFSPPPEHPGEAWIGGDVEASLRLLAVLQQTPAYDQVVGVEARRWVKDKQLVIVTDAGNRVVWGAAPDEWAPGEPSLATKLAWLNTLRSEARFNRRIDAGQAVVKLTNPRGVMVDASAAGASAGANGTGAGTGNDAAPDASSTNPSGPRSAGSPRTNPSPGPAGSSTPRRAIASARAAG